MGAVCCRERSATLLVDRDSGRQERTSARATALLEMLVREEPWEGVGSP